MAQGIERLDLFSLAPVLDVHTAHALLDVVFAFVDHVVGDTELTHEGGRRKEITAFLDRKLSQIARQITLIDQLDDLLKQQRKAIIHEAVTGKIDLSAAPLEKVETQTF